MFMVVGPFLWQQFGPNDPGPENSPPADVGPAQPTSDNLGIRVDLVCVQGGKGDVFGPSELRVGVLVTRPNGKSVTLTGPGRGALLVTGDGCYDLGSFSLQVNTVKPEETLTLVFLVQELDELTDAEKYSLDTIVGIAGGVLEKALNGGTLTAPVSPQVLVITSAASMAIEWAQKPDILLNNSLQLNAENDWYRDRHLRIDSADGVISVKISVLEGPKDGETGKPAEVPTLIPRPTLSATATPTNSLTKSPPTPTSDPNPPPPNWDPTDGSLIGNLQVCIPAALVGRATLHLERKTLEKDSDGNPIWIPIEKVSMDRHGKVWGLPINSTSWGRKGQPYRGELWVNSQPSGLKFGYGGDEFIVRPDEMNPLPNGAWCK